MGQQQLLLLVLGILIVALATAAGINAFEENSQKSEKDALVSDALRVATELNAYKTKASEMGGGGGAWPASLAEAGFETHTRGESGTAYYDTPHGSLALDGTTAGGAPILALRPASADEAVGEVAYDEARGAFVYRER